MELGQGRVISDGPEDVPTDHRIKLNTRHVFSQVGQSWSHSPNLDLKANQASQQRCRARSKIIIALSTAPTFAIRFPSGDKVTPILSDQRRSAYSLPPERKSSEEKMATAILSRPYNSHVQMLLLGSLFIRCILAHHMPS